MDGSLLCFLSLIMIPIGWRIIDCCFKSGIYRQVYELEGSFEVELDFVQLSKNILMRVMKETKASAGIIYWFDETQNKFKLRSLQGIPIGKLNQITQLLTRKSGLLEQVTDKQTGLMIKDLLSHPLTNGSVAKELTKLYSTILALPLNANKKTIGILVLFKTGAVFNRREKRLLDFFAPRASIQLNHSRLYSLATETALENARLYVNISKLYHKVIFDSLTGLYNRHFLMQKLKEEIKKTYRFKQPLSLIFTDIDLFKQINDEHGHPAGDQVLSEFGDLLKKSIREFDLACRFGGEEFIILLPQTDSVNANLLAEKLREKVAATLFCANNIRITASFGISTFLDTDISEAGTIGDEALNYLAEDLLAWADEALYRAKKTGRNKAITYEKQVKSAK